MCSEINFDSRALADINSHKLNFTKEFTPIVEGERGQGVPCDDKLILCDVDWSSTKISKNPDVSYFHNLTASVSALNRKNYIESNKNIPRVVGGGWRGLGLFIAIRIFVQTSLVLPRFRSYYGQTDLLYSAHEFLLIWTRSPLCRTYILKIKIGCSYTVITLTLRCSDLLSLSLNG